MGFKRMKEELSPRKEKLVWALIKKKERSTRPNLLSLGSTGFQSPFPYPVEPVSDNRSFSFKRCP